MDSSSSSSPSKDKKNKKPPPSVPAARAASSILFPRRYVIGLAIFAVVLISGVVSLRLITNTFDPFFVVASDSMVPTLQVGDVVVIQHTAVGDDGNSGGGSGSSSNNNGKGSGGWGHHRHHLQLLRHLIL
jgi:uncharacterized membrane protein YgcG